MKKTTELPRFSIDVFDQSLSTPKSVDAVTDLHPPQISVLMQSMVSGLFPINIRYH